MHCSLRNPTVVRISRAMRAFRMLLVSQGAQVMSSHGVNVPPGIPAFTLDEVQTAADQMASPDGEVRVRIRRSVVALNQR